MRLWMFTKHAYKFRSPSATILKVYSIKEYYKMFVWRICPRYEFYKLL